MKEIRDGAMSHDHGTCVRGKRSFFYLTSDDEIPNRVMVRGVVFSSSSDSKPRDGGGVSSGSGASGSVSGSASLAEKRRAKFGDVPTGGVGKRSHFGGRGRGRGRGRGTFSVEVGIAMDMAVLVMMICSDHKSRLNEAVLAIVRDGKGDG